MKPHHLNDSQSKSSSFKWLATSFVNDYSGEQTRYFSLSASNDLVKAETCQPRNLSFLIDKPKHRTALISFPGSGNTWMRHLIQELTGFYTGSVYQDKGLAENGFPGELVPVIDSTRHCIVYKTHLATKQTLKLFTKAIIIIRNPLHAIKSFFNYEYATKGNSAKRQRLENGDRRVKDLISSNKTKSRSKHVDHANTSLFHTRKWSDFVDDRLRRWRRKNVFWLEKFQHNSIVVLYESLKGNNSAELLRIGEFLGVQVKPKDLLCTIVNKEGQFHRQARNKTASSVVSLYTSKQKEEIRKSVCEVSHVAKSLSIDLDISQYLVKLSKKNDTHC
ncbi:WSCD family member CG9164-like [Ylistrum balloti]|uniref:WSCD family member CG9164-like n=1 Tax=Ylistrum balloti TaxID=509963 RepID=UPI002905B005|nr:WSCD family member CG9164-like [Ylistrum balloti]